MCHEVFCVCIECEVVEQIQTVPAVSTSKVVMPVADETENVTRWIVDQNFRRDQERLKIPFGEWLDRWFDYLLDREGLSTKK